MENELLKEAIQVLKNNKRPELINCTMYGQYTADVKEFLYSDRKEEYSIIEKNPEPKLVRSAKAFTALIKEELKRRNNATGEKATVKLNLDGGYFIADENFGEGITHFERLNSQQWEIVKNGINKIYDHKTFLLFLQKLKPSISAFNEVFKQFATLRIIGQTELTSNPIFTEDGQNSGFSCRYKLEDGCDGEDTFPTGFNVNVAFAKAGTFKYDLPIDLLFTRSADNELNIEVLCPTFENIEELAIIDEANYIKSEAEEYENLLIISDL